MQLLQPLLYVCSYKSLSVTVLPGSGIMQSKTSVFGNMEQGWVQGGREGACGS
jgi:hypothetical protein